MKHRMEVEKYTPGFVIDPWGDEQHKTHESPDDLAFVVCDQPSSILIIVNC